MLNISKPLSSGQAQAYHKLEFTSETANYYKQDGAVQGQWQGRLAERMGLSGTVGAAFLRPPIMACNFGKHMVISSSYGR
jgi:hypothetical protein